MAKSKYGNIKDSRIINGEEVKFDSRKEAKRFDELYVMAKAGLIKELTLQPSYVILDGYEHEGKKVLPIKYNADFRYVEHGFIVVEDVKSSKSSVTDIYRLKKKMFLYRYGTELVFREVF